MVGSIRQYFYTHFPKKTKTMEEFIELARTRGVTAIDITLAVETENSVMTGAVGVVANFRHEIQYRGVTPNGRHVLYIWSAYRFGSENGTADAEERRRKYVHHCLFAAEGKKKLAGQFPKVLIRIFSATGEILDDAFFASLRQEAEVIGGILG